MFILVLQLVSALVCAFFALRALFRKQTLPLPPGPKGLPILGSIFQYPSSQEWSAFRDLSVEYNSDIIYFNILGQPLIVLNTEDAANELLVKRALIYSDKPDFTMMNDILGFTWNFAFQRYGDKWKEHRKLFHRTLEGPNLVAQQYPHIMHATRNLLQHIQERPTQFVTDLRLYAGQIVLRAAYGIEVIDNNDPYVVTADTVMTALSIASRPGAYWVDSLPILRWVPSWMPAIAWCGLAALG